MNQKLDDFMKKIAKYMLFAMNFALLVVGLGLCIVLFLEAWSIAQLAITAIYNDTAYTLVVEEIIYFFLYFEFMALIVQYFRNNYHFPLRYFIYIGITAVIRLIIVDHDIALHVLIWAGTILLLSISLAVVNKFVKHD